MMKTVRKNYNDVLTILALSFWQENNKLLSAAHANNDFKFIFIEKIFSVNNYALVKKVLGKYSAL